MPDSKQLTPKEKLFRLLNPTCVEDWGLTISCSELGTFEEGRAFVREFYEKYVPGLVERHKDTHKNQPWPEDPDCWFLKDSDYMKKIFRMQ